MSKDCSICLLSAVLMNGLCADSSFEKQPRLSASITAHKIVMLLLEDACT